MSPPPTQGSAADTETAATHAALFEQLVSGHAQMVLTFLGKLPDPHTGEPAEPDLTAAKIFIDQLDMLQVKTRGHLGASETRLLERTLSTVHGAFLECAKALNSQAT
ncbi:MAG: DUF1844 domain-containing protein [Pedosphaera sp.]|nr:DUF1844 domain-containing protein [Pedosphaera sp.]